MKLFTFVLIVVIVVLVGQLAGEWNLVPYVNRLGEALAAWKVEG